MQVAYRTRYACLVSPRLPAQNNRLQVVNEMSSGGQRLEAQGLHAPEGYVAAANPGRRRQSI